MSGVVITGLGVVSSIGIGAPAFEQGLRSGACGAAPIRRFDASEYRSKAAFEIHDEVRPDPTRTAGIPQTARYGRTAAFALAALAEAVHGAGLHRDDLTGGVHALAFGGSTAGMPEAEGDLLGLGEGEDFWAVAEPERFLSTPVGTTADVLARAAGLRGPVSTISTACSSATNAVGQALHWLRAGRADRVLAGGSDAHCRLTHAGFCALSLVAPERPLPFDARRQGMVIGEGAAMFVLEREADARARGATVLGRILGFGNVAEAHHLVQPKDDGEGAARAMTMALRDAGVEPTRVGYVNAHGTATIQNDLSESRGIRTVLGAHADAVPVSSTKSQVGHLLGASGAVELAAVLLGLNGGFVPPCAGWEEADPEIDLDIVAGTARSAAVEVALSNSFAFGGNDSSLCVGHPEGAA
ncbi:MAG: beta-ketoacyl-[acyl-carrier-protein] synthase family protein [Proteobacteria bacterium]|nr:beta-ketoacyl-[acyl-carrier-protein] synthase family protein [Pseudomonadota bacterium]